MNSRIDIYWSNSYFESEVTELAFFPLISLYKDVFDKDLNNFNQLDDKAKKNLKRYIQCPASQKELKNIYVVKAPHDLQLFWDEKTDRLAAKIVKRKNLNQLVHIRGKGLITIKWASTFFCKDNIEMSQIPAYYHDNDFINSTFLTSGKFNISKWFRHVDPTFIMKKRKINIKRGDALFYVKFHTNKKVNLKHFNMNEKLHHYENVTTSLKMDVPFLPLESAYELFLEKKYNSRILKEIKNNLTGY